MNEKPMKPSYVGVAIKIETDGWFVASNAPPPSRTPTGLPSCETRPMAVTRQHQYASPDLPDYMRIKHVELLDRSPGPGNCQVVRWWEQPAAAAPARAVSLKSGISHRAPDTWKIRGVPVLDDAAAPGRARRRRPADWWEEIGCREAPTGSPVTRTSHISADLPSCFQIGGVPMEFRGTSPNVPPLRTSKWRQRGAAEEAAEEGGRAGWSPPSALGAPPRAFIEAPRRHAAAIANASPRGGGSSPHRCVSDRISP